MTMEDEDSFPVELHVPCDTCGSSDGMTVYSDGHTFCFVCEAWNPGDGTKRKEKVRVKVAKGLIPQEDLVVGGLPARGITEKTCKKYGYYKSRLHGDMVQVACIYDDHGDMIGQKIRDRNKNFMSRGDVGDRFVGQHLWPGGGKKLVITEGEIDMLTVSQVQDNKWPVVSLPCGCKSAKKTFKAQMEWLETFEDVIVMFDMDTPGKEAVQSVEGILSPGRLKVATLPLKDPNECLLNDKADEIIKAIWNAKTYKPDGIINGSELWDELMDEDEQVESYEFPWDIDLQKMTMGARLGEMIMLTAGTGIGKSTIARQIAHHLGVNLGVKVGLMMLEENKKRTAKGIMSVQAGKRLHIHWNTTSAEEKSKAFNETMGTGNFVIYDHFGSIEGSNLLSRMRYMATGEGCKFLILDHISIAISGLEGDKDERKAIDYLMTHMRSLTEEVGIGILVISHLRKMEGDKQSHEEGAAISMDHLRGSGTLKQIPDTIIAGERNQQAEGDEKNLVRLRLLKCRFTGETGIAGHLYYNKETDRLEAVDRVSDYSSERKVDLGGSDEESPF